MKSYRNRALELILRPTDCRADLFADYRIPLRHPYIPILIIERMAGWEHF